MPPQKRHKNNQGLPAGWRYRYGAYYYRVPKRQRHLFDGRREYRLGRTLPEAHQEYGRRTAVGPVYTMREAFTRYKIAEVPKKAESTHRDQKRMLDKLTEIMGDSPAHAVEAHHCYQIRDHFHRTAGARAANSYMALLSHVFTMLGEWGAIKTHPMITAGFRKLRVQSSIRVPTADEIDEALTVAPPVIAAYVQLKRLTGLRQTDMLVLHRDFIQDDGFHVTPRKTSKTSRKSLVFAWDDDDVLWTAIQACIALQQGRKLHKRSRYLFATRSGKPYTPDGFRTIWQRWMRDALERTELEQSFQERSIRNWVGDVSDSDQDAADRLGNSIEIARKHYRRKPAVVTPLIFKSGGKAENSGGTGSGDPS